jgi:hypothetical protein
MFGLRHGLFGPPLPGHTQSTTMAGIARFERHRGLLRRAGVTPANDLEQTTKASTPRVDVGGHRFCATASISCGRNANPFRLAEAID